MRGARIPFDRRMMRKPLSDEEMSELASRIYEDSPEFHKVLEELKEVIDQRQQEKGDIDGKEARHPTKR